MINLQKQRYIYFIRAIGDAEGRIKIGCSYKPASRLAKIGIWSPYPLEVIAVAPGDFSVERKLHTYFWVDRLHREWFRSSPALVFVMNQMAAGVPFADAVARLEQRAAA